MRTFAIIACGVLLACSAWAQKLSVPPENASNLPPRQISATDLLAITVYGAPELSRSVRVTEDGLIRLPMLAAKITAKGLMPAELETKLAEALIAENLLVDPVVTINIAQYGTRPVSIAGAVRHPLTFEIHERISLLDALARAEGLSPEAGTEILITRKDQPVAERISVRDLLERANPEANVPLTGGEEVRVPEAGRVFVVGNVKKPGAFRVDASTSMTILQALALSEGLSQFSAKVGYIYRPDGSAVKKEIPVELRKIMDRKASDVALAPGDIFYVPDNRRGRVTATAIERAMSFAVGTASGALILGVNR